MQKLNMRYNKMITYYRKYSKNLLFLTKKISKTKKKLTKYPARKNADQAFKQNSLCVRYVNFKYQI